MPQHCSRPVKQTKVARLLKGDENLRHSMELSCQREKADSEGLEVLARCKALNEFIKKGLLAEVEDDTAPGRQHKAAAAGRRCTTAGPKGVPHAERHITSPPRPACSPAASLTSRITAKESEALLELLLSDELVAASAAQTAASTAAAPGSADPSTSTSACEGLHQPSSALVKSSGTPSIADTQLPLAEAAPRTEGSTGSQQPSPAAAPACSSSDMLDDVIGLLNAPEVASDLAPSPSGSSHCQQQCSNTPQGGPPQPQQQPQGGSPSPPQAACREAHRQAWVRPPEQQQEALRAAAVKHASINAAWRGFYSYWGPHAASTIQHYWRAYKARQQYLQLREAAVVLQAGCRGHLLRVSSQNLLRLHREEQQHQQLELKLLQQRQREQQREREARERQQQQMLQEQKEREAQQQERQRRHDAAVALQCAVRGWTARRVCAGLSTAAAAAAAVAAVEAANSAGVHEDGCPAEAGMSATPSTCSRASDSTDSCSNSRGSSRQSHSRGSARSACSLDTPAAAAETACKGQEGMQQAVTSPLQVQDWQGPGQAGPLEEQQQQQYSLPGLVIRHAAEARTASHGGDQHQAGSDCREELARQLVQRAGQLGVAEGVQAAELATRALMASSSARQLQSALQAVRTARPTM